MVSEAKLKPIKGTWFKILCPKHMLQRLPIALTQIKAGNKVISKQVISNIEAFV